MELIHLLLCIHLGRIFAEVWINAYVPTGVVIRLLSFLCEKIVPGSFCINNAAYAIDLESSQ